MLGVFMLMADFEEDFRAVNINRFGSYSTTCWIVVFVNEGLWHAEQLLALVATTGLRTPFSANTLP